MPVSETKQFNKHIWGIRFEEILSPPDYLIWRLKINNPFYDKNKGRYQIGINEKLLRRAISEGVKEFRLIVGQKEIPFKPPTEKELKVKDRKKEFEDKPSLFENSSPLRIYHFII